MEAGKEPSEPNTKVNLLVTGSGLKAMGSRVDGDYQLAYGCTHAIGGLFVETLVSFSHKAEKLIFEWICKTKDNKVVYEQAWHFMLIHHAENARFYQGSYRCADGSHLFV